MPPRRVTHYGERAADLIEAARAQVAAAVGAGQRSAVHLGRHRSQQPGYFWRGALLPRLRPAHRDRAHRAQGGARSLPRTRTPRVEDHLPGAGRARAGDPEEVAAALRDDTVLVSLMLVNNETGVIQDIAVRSPTCARPMAGRGFTWMPRKRRQGVRGLCGTGRRSDVVVRPQGLWAERGRRAVDLARGGRGDAS